MNQLHFGDELTAPRTADGAPAVGSETGAVSEPSQHQRLRGNRTFGSVARVTYPDPEIRCIMQ
jgi:hypothetical protein